MGNMVEVESGLFDMLISACGEDGDRCTDCVYQSECNKLSAEVEVVEHESERSCDHDLFERHKEDIWDFFDDNKQLWTGNRHPDRERNAFVWIATHTDGVEGVAMFQTLTVEPHDCSGYHEIAVRWRDKDGKWSGYHITGHGYIIGRNTNGH